jgi:hypothetical protein
MSSSSSVHELLGQIRDFVSLDRRNLEPVITELHALLNKHDPEITERKGRRYPLVRENFNPDLILKNIRDTAQDQALTVPQIRFKADELSRSKHIPLPNSTRKHKEPLMQWFEVHWDHIVGDIMKWKGEPITGEMGK